MVGKTGVTVRVLSNRLPSTADAIHAETVKNVSTAGYAIEATAKQLVHVITGNLRRSITTQISEGGLRAEIGPSAEYGKWEEWGTRNRAAHPFLRPAFEREIPRFVDRQKAILRRGAR